MAEQQTQQQPASLPVIELTDAEFQRVNWAIRMADKLAALETILKSTLQSTGAYNNVDPKQWVRLRPSARRTEVAERLHDAADKLRLIAQRLVDESERMGV